MHTLMNDLLERYSIRCAEIGDVGVVVGARSMAGSGLGQIVIEISEGAAISIPGDWRTVMNLVEAFLGTEVEVIECEGSAYGCHALCPL